MIKTLEVASYQENGQLSVKWLYLFGQGQNYLGKWPARPAIWIIIWATFILKWPIICNNLLNGYIYLEKGQNYLGHLPARPFCKMAITIR